MKTTAIYILITILFSPFTTTKIKALKALNPINITIKAPPIKKESIEKQLINLRMDGITEYKHCKTPLQKGFFRIAESESNYFEVGRLDLRLANTVGVFQIAEDYFPKYGNLPAPLAGTGIVYDFETQVHMMKIMCKEYIKIIKAVTGLTPEKFVKELSKRIGKKINICGVFYMMHLAPYGWISMWNGTSITGFSNGLTNCRKKLIQGSDYENRYSSSGEPISK